MALQQDSVDERGSSGQHAYACSEFMPVTKTVGSSELLAHAGVISVSSKELANAGAVQPGLAYAPKATLSETIFVPVIITRT